MSISNITLTSTQESVFKQVKEFLKSDAPVFILKGYAGTGKTTMVRHIVNYISQSLNKEPCLMAPTGRAARVLAKKTGCKASTIHRAIYSTKHYEVKEAEDVAESGFKIIFQINVSDDNTIAIVDEASMVSSKKTEHELLQFGTGVLIDDLLTFVRPSFSGKIIFVGDPAQLPPVGDNQSCALSEKYFEKMGLKYETAKLTDVLRQNGESMILKDAMMVRNLLSSEKRNRLEFHEKNGEVESIEPQRVVDKYISLGTDAASGGSVIVAYSNRMVTDYNQEVRRRIYGSDLPLQKGDSLMVVRNNYSLNLMNGDFTKVVSLGRTESLSAPVYVQKGGRRERVIITIDFQNATVLNDDDEPIECKLILSLLDNIQPSLGVDQQKALYINFCMRNARLKPGNQPFTEALKKDPYYNALQVKYGYAVTGHKCQGGEWNVVFVDYSNRTGLDNDSLRWNYTATTRAQHTLYITNLPHITPFDKFYIDTISKMSKVSPEFRKFRKIEDSPFHTTGAPDFLLAKCQCIRHNMQYSPYRILSIESRPYRETYTIETPDGTERFDLTYKGSGAFHKAVRLQEATCHTALIEAKLNNEELMPTICDYIPSDDTHKQLYAYIRSACDSLNIKLINAVEHADSYYTMFYFVTSGTISSLQVYNDAKGFIKRAHPASFAGTDDKKLQELIGLLKK